jgi:hypothetical protein
MNFKTITRENNPQKGESQGSYFNIPGHKDFAMFYVPVLQENGTEAYDKYTMKQPFSVNFMYSVAIITNKMELLNKMNEMMHYEFNAITTYISPNDHPMPLTLEDISDQSEYTIDDRKYYSQTFKIKLKGYIIRREDYKVERIPSRLVIASHDSDAAGVVNRRGKNRTEDERVKFMVMGEESNPNNNKTEFLEDRLATSEACEVPPLNDDNVTPSEILEPIEVVDCYDEKDEKYIHKTMKIIMNFDECTLEMSFVIDKEMILETIETKNVKDINIYVNDEEINLENEVRFYPEDEIRVKTTKDDEYSGSEVVLIGYDPNVVIDTENIPESSLDEPMAEEDIIIDSTL